MDSKEDSKKHEFHENDFLYCKVEKPRVFDPRGRVVLTPSGEIVLTL